MAFLLPSADLICEILVIIKQYETAIQIKQRMPAMRSVTSVNISFIVESEHDNLNNGGLSQKK